VIGGVLVRATVLESVLRGMLRNIGAFWEDALQVQSPEDTVAQEQRTDEYHG
jgi:hypothetical protein